MKPNGETYHRHLLISITVRHCMVCSGIFTFCTGYFEYLLVKLYSKAVVPPVLEIVQKRVLRHQLNSSMFACSALFGESCFLPYRPDLLVGTSFGMVRVCAAFYDNP